MERVKGGKEGGEREGGGGKVRRVDWRGGGRVEERVRNGPDGIGSSKMMERKGL